MTMLLRYSEACTPLPPMITTAHANPVRTLSLVEIIDFKWLMAGDGRRVHVERLQADPAYARDCLQQGADSQIPALRECASRLALVLHITLQTR